MESSEATHAGLAFYAQLGLLFAVLLGSIAFHYGLRGFQRPRTDTQWYVPMSSAERGRSMIEEYGCGACHTISGVRSARGLVGPPLSRMRERVYLAGVLPHTPQNLVRWIQDPQSIDEDTAMPRLGVSEQDARDIAAYLYEAQ